MQLDYWHWNPLSEFQIFGLMFSGFLFFGMFATLHFRQRQRKVKIAMSWAGIERAATEFGKSNPVRVSTGLPLGRIDCESVIAGPIQEYNEQVKLARELLRTPTGLSQFTIIEVYIATPFIYLLHKYNAVMSNVWLQSMFVPISMPLATKLYKVTEQKFLFL